MADTRALIETGVRRFLAAVPALATLNLAAALELRGRGDVQLYRVEMPGPQSSKDLRGDERVRLIVPRSHFNALAEKGTVRHWHEAFATGQAKAEGTPEILKLIASVVER